MKHRLLALVLLFIETAGAFASEDAHGGHGEHHGIPWGTMFFSAVNFSLFLLLLARTVLPALKTWAITRRERIVDELQAAARAKAEAEALKREWEERMASLDRELAEIRDRALADAQRERERILAAAQQTAEAIAVDAEKAAAQELRKAKAELREQVAALAVDMARDVIRQRLTDGDQKRFLDDFLREVRP